eukprot:760818-Hanusia_phi.AAC.1
MPRPSEVAPLLLLSTCRQIKSVFSKIRNVNITKDVYAIIQAYHELKFLQDIDHSISKSELSGHDIHSERSHEKLPRPAFVDQEASRIELQESRSGPSTGTEAFAFTHVTFAPSNPSLVCISGHDGRCRLWDVDSMVKLDEIGGHASAVNMAAFSSAGPLLACASDDGSLSVWEVARRAGDRTRLVARCRSKEQGDKDGHEDAVGRCCFHPDGYLIISSSDDLSIKIWSLPSSSSSSSSSSSFAKVVTTLSPQGSSITLLCCSLLRPLLLSGDEEGSLVLWEITLLQEPGGRQGVKGSEVWRRREREYAVLCACFSPDGEIFLVGHEDMSLLIICCSSHAVLALLLLEVVP